MPLAVHPKLVNVGEIRRMLLVRPDHLGDVLFMTPALRLLRSHLPDAHITCLVGPWSRAVLDNNKNIDELITWDFPWFNRRMKASIAEPYTVLRDLARSLQYSSYDAVINFRFDFWWGALAFYLAGIPQRIGYDIADCSPFLTHKFPYVRGRHEVEQNIGLVEQFLCLAEDTKQSNHGSLEFAVAEADEKFVADYLFAKGIREGDLLVGLHPGTGSPSKQWDVERFAKVGDELAQKQGCIIVVTGSLAERGLATEIANRVNGKCIVAAGDTALGQLAAILRRCQLVIGVDSGAMHLAVAVGTPTVHLFGPSDHRIFGPFGDLQNHRVVRSSLPCSPCGRFDFSPSNGINDCMSSITADQVIEEAVKLLKMWSAG